MLLRLLPLMAGILPVAAVHASYWLAIQADRVPACLPYLAGCTSISATGRYPPASLLFKPVMMTEAVLLVVYWIAAILWLRALQDSYGERHAHRDIFLALAGCLGALALIVYVTFLGTQEPFYEFMRRFGIYFYFLGTVIAQVALAWRAGVLARRHDLSVLRRVTSAQLVLAGTPFLLGILNLSLKPFLENPDPMENVIEWLATLMMQLCFVLSFFAWRANAGQTSAVP